MKRSILKAAALVLFTMGFALAQNPSCPRADCPHEGQCACQQNGTCNGTGNGRGDCDGSCRRIRQGRQGQSGQANPAPAQKPAETNSPQDKQ